MDEIHLAARRGDIAEMRRLLDEGVPLDLRDSRQGHTPLMEACLSSSAGIDAVDFLISQGADVNALVTRASPYLPDFTLLDNAEYQLDEETRELLEQSRAIMASNQSLVEKSGEEQPSVLSLAVKQASLEKLQRLIDAGADPAFTSASGYTPMILAACAGRLDVVELLIAAGASSGGSTIYGESVLRSFSRTGDFPAVRRLLELGADAESLCWTALHRAVVLGTLEEVEQLLDEGADPEASDYWERTAFLLAVHGGEIAKAELLLSRGADRAAKGRCARPAPHYPTDRDEAAMLRWLLERGFYFGAEDGHGHTPVMDAVENDAASCFDVLLEAGADWETGRYGSTPLIGEATHPRIIQRLLELGENPAHIEKEARRKWIGLGTCGEPPATRAEYEQGSSRRFGNANPERMAVPFWNAMVRCGWTGFHAARLFGDDSYERGDPVWSHDRFGSSITPLPDGRFIQIAGEHEDSYDPDFCIYNDVIIHDGKGGFEILGYPEEVFPPTDFHSATLVDEWIYLIGSLGYPDTRKNGETPVFCFHIATGSIERVSTGGDFPGWIYEHQAMLEKGSIRVSGGKVWRATAGGESSIGDLEGSYSLELATGMWTQR